MDYGFTEYQTAIRDLSREITAPAAETATAPRLNSYCQTGRS